MYAIVHGRQRADSSTAIVIENGVFVKRSG